MKSALRCKQLWLTVQKAESYFGRHASFQSLLSRGPLPALAHSASLPWSQDGGQSPRERKNHDWDQGKRGQGRPGPKPRSGPEPGSGPGSGTGSKLGPEPGHATKARPGVRLGPEPGVGPGQGPGPESGQSGVGPGRGQDLRQGQSHRAQGQAAGQP